MRKMHPVSLTALLIAAMLLPPELALAQRGGHGGGGGGRAGGGGHARPSGRPNVSSPNLSRPSAGPRPVSRPSTSRPQTMQTQRPQGNRPMGGVHPTVQRPSTQGRPSQLPVSQRPGQERPQFQGRPPVTAQRPQGTGGSRPGNRPSTSIPHLPGGGSSRPDFSSRPNTDRPSTRPTLPETSRPGAGGRPGATSRPGTRPGQLDDFLGLERPSRPVTRPEETRPGSRPGTGPGTRPEFRPEVRPETRPSRPGGGIAGRPGATTRPETRPGRPQTRPQPGRPGQRPDWSHHRPGVNNPTIHHRPDWVHLTNDSRHNINRRWTTATHHHPGSSWRWSQNRASYWHGWGHGVRSNWHHHHHHHGYFNDVWWGRHHHHLGGWHYSYHFHNHPWGYWWGRPTWPVMQSWFVWAPTTTTVWANPVQYDYGTGGNIYVQDNSVYLGGEQIASTEDFAMSAAELATVAPPENEEEAEASDWLPLGTFALSTGEKDVEPTRIVQMAVNRDGIVSGTIYNTLTDVSQTIQGKVDPETQRVAFRIGESETIVAETGLYNLTQDEVPLWVHFGPLETETYLLVRLDGEEEYEEDGSELR